MGNLNFNSAEVEPNTGGEFTPVPPGEYVMIVTESEVKPTKALNGTYLKTKFEIVEGDFKGRGIFVNFNLRNPSAEAEKIGQGQLSALCHACGIAGMVEESSELHGIVFRAKVGVKPAKGEYGPSNYITSYVIEDKTKPVKKGKATKAETKAEINNLEDDDVPF